MEISKEKFNDYRKVQYSGVINMFDINNGCKLSGLTRDEYIEIMKNYSKLREKYGDYKED